VSRVREPLAPARALLGRFHCGRSCCSLWATVSTRRLKAVNPDSAVELGKRKAGQGGSDEPVQFWPWYGVCSLSLGLEVSAVVAFVLLAPCNVYPVAPQPGSSHLQAGEYGAVLLLSSSAVAR
jgi:hypothetical protein